MSRSVARGISYVALALAGALATCKEGLAPPETGAILLEIRLQRDGPAGTAVVVSKAEVPLPSVTSQTAAAGFDSARARAQGPTNTTVNLRLVSGFWEGTLDGLRPGSYCVTVEGFVAGRLDRQGDTCGVAVAAGDAKPVTVTLGPRTPSGLVARPVSLSEIDLVWTDNATDEDGFRIERCAGPGCTSFTEIANLGSNVTASANTGLSASTNYS